MSAPCLQRNRARDCKPSALSCACLHCRTSSTNSVPTSSNARARAQTVTALISWSDLLGRPLKHITGIGRDSVSNAPPPCGIFAILGARGTSARRSQLCQILPIQFSLRVRGTVSAGIISLGGSKSARRRGRFAKCFDECLGLSDGRTVDDGEPHWQAFADHCREVLGMYGHDDRAFDCLKAIGTKS